MFLLTIYIHFSLLQIEQFPLLVEIGGNQQTIFNVTNFGYFSLNKERHYIQTP